MLIHNILQSVDMPSQVNSDDEVVSALVTSTQEIPGRTIQLITCKAKGNVGCFEDTMEGLFEPTVATQNLPNHLCVARSLSTITPDKKVVLQVMNVSPSPIKICKGMKLGEVIPMQSVQLAECDNIKASDEELSIPDLSGCFRIIVH